MNFFSGGNKFDETQCKTNLKLAVTRLGLQKTKKENLTKNLKREIAELLRVGKVESARIKVESVIREDFIVEAYEILELFCQLVLSRLGTIQVAKECPPDLKEAICTLMYAAPRAEVKELQVIRQQLFYKFGKELTNEATMNKDNCVNARVVHKLAVQTPENYMVYNYLNEIAKAYGVDWQSDVIPPDPISSPSITASSLTPDHHHHHHSHNSNIEPTFNFPDVPSKGQSQSNQDMLLQFPSAPKSFSTQTPFTTTTTTTTVITTPTPTPNGFPMVPQEPDIPNFNPSDLPGYGFPSPPSFSTPQPQIQQPQTPQPSSSSSDFVFPSVPSSNTSSNKNTTNFDDLFPPTPSNTNNSSSSSVPDFDELTARFERLKKRDG